MKFEINHETGKRGRIGKISTPHGDIITPAYVTVGTKATVKSLSIEQIKQTKSQVVLANTYHLYLEPGEKIIESHGGFAPFMKWEGPTMTDSGGFQVFSLGEAFGTNVSKVAKGEPEVIDSKRNTSTQKMATIDEEGVTFKSYKDGSSHRFTPERSMEIQWTLGADMIFAFDECTSPHASHEYQMQAIQRTLRWGARCLDRHQELDTQNIQALFGVVQGGRHADLREYCAKEIAALTGKQGNQFDGFGIGGSFNKDDMFTAVSWVNDNLPKEKPRHLLGIGEPGDILKAMQEGCDLFDCVTASRIARNGNAYTRGGQINLFNASMRTDNTVLEKGCGCSTCITGYTRSYIAHLFHSHEMLAAPLVTMHNLWFINNLVEEARNAMMENTLETYTQEFEKRFYLK